MASRKPSRKTPAATDRLVPTLRDAVEVVDRALAALGRPAGKPPRRAARAKRPRPGKA